MLVTTHDFNYAMGFIKEDEIYNPQTGVSEFSSTALNQSPLMINQLIIFYFCSITGEAHCK